MGAWHSKGSTCRPIHLGIREFRSELLGFPGGKHDDQVDALGLIGQLLDKMSAGQAPKTPIPPKPDSGYRPIALFGADDWLCY